jgi:hypothetical protein
MQDEQKLIDLITRGLESAKERHALISERVLRMELSLEQVSKLGEMQKIQMRVDQLEEHAKESRDKQKENVRWFRGIVASLIVALLMAVFNFIRINLR